MCLSPHVLSAPGDILFEEEFNSNGDYNSDWSDSGSGDASVTTETYSSASRALRIGEGTHTVTSDSGRIDTSGISGADLSLWIRRGADSFSNRPEAGEDLVLEYLNSSSSWINLDTYAGSGTAGEILTPTFTLPADGLHAAFRLRFRVLGGSNNQDYWHIDDVVVTETGAAAACGTYEDTFSSNSYSNSDGTLDWSTNSWIETNDDGNSNSGNAEISGNELRLSGNGTASNTMIARQIDTSGQSSITLEFDFNTAGGVDTADSAVFEVSSDGGSNWTTLETLTGIGNNVSGSRSFDISAYAASNMQIRFAISPDSGGACCYDSGGERLELDNISVTSCTSSAITHYFVSHAGSGVTCEAVDVSIVAHDSGEIATDASGNTIRITATSLTGGWTAADTGWSLDSGTGSDSYPSAGVVEYTFGSGESAVVLNFSNISVADIDFDVVDLGDASLTDIDGDVVEDEVLSFADTGFLFYDDSDTNGDRDPDGLGGFEGIQSELLSGATSTQMILRAVQTNDETGACEARVTGLQTVSMGYECINPISCTNDADYALISGTPAGRNDLGNNGNLNGVNLTFDGDGEAPFTLEYLDAGQIRLIAQLALAADPSTGDPAITLYGTSDNTTAAPAAFVITSVNDGSGNDADGTAFITSESTFEIEVEAQNADGDPTPNFGNEIASESIRLSIQSVDMPPGGNSGTLTYSLSNSAGTWTSPASSWNEAGTFTLLADLDDSDGDSVYMGTSLGILSGTRANVGRFYPASFDLLAGGTVANGCAAGGFTYMSDQIPMYFPIDVAINIAPLGSSGGNLNNYQTGYTPLASFALVAENNNSGVELSSRANLQGGAWVVDGVSGDVDYRFAASNDAAFRRALTGLNETVDGPYTSIQLGLVADGTDSIDFLAADLTMRADQSNDCVADGDCNAAAIGSPLSLVFGRLYGSDAHGPESAALAVPLEVQFWDGNEFITQANDSCTAIAVTDIEFDGSALVSDAELDVTVGGGTTTGSFTNYTTASDVTFANGDAGLTFSAPGVGNTGQFNVDIDLANYPWLRNDWDGDGDYANDTAVPSMEIEFGRYRGHDRIIYWEEILD